MRENWQIVAALVFAFVVIVVAMWRDNRAPKSGRFTRRPGPVGSTRPTDSRM